MAELLPANVRQTTEFFFTGKESGTIVRVAVEDGKNLATLQEIGQQIAQLALTIGQMTGEDARVSTAAEVDEYREIEKQNLLDFDVEVGPRNE